ncbi:MAG: hypothetical protein EA416_03810 [Trueperaceae bacterium]|nr:MAG: hypothetical protein EA416_03810 [Trueperaceae bacterium]
MTQTLDWNDVLGESTSVCHRSGDGTSDLRSILQRHDDEDRERWIVRNVVVVTGSGLARRSKSRAAFDVDRGTVIEVEPSTVGGGLDMDRLAASITKQLAAGSHSARDVARESSGLATENAADPSGTSEAIAAAELIARRSFPPDAHIDWSEDVDDEGVPYTLMRVVSPGSPEHVHSAYLAFMRAWVREETPERRRPIRVAYRAGGSG